MPEFRTSQGHTLLLPDGEIRVGSAVSNEVPVAAHLGLAAMHFRLQPWENGHFIEDAGSGLGTLVNGQPVNWKPLAHGDVITAGDLEVTYTQYSGSQPAAAVPLAPAPLPLHPPHFVHPGTMALAPTPVADPTAALPLPAYLLARTERRANPAAAAVSEAAPPSWLPPDLLPGAGPPGDDGTSLIVPQAPGINLLNTKPAGAPCRKVSPGRRILLAAAGLTLLCWGGHEAWKRGHFEKITSSLRGAVSHGGPVPGVFLPTGGTSESKW